MKTRVLFAAVLACAAATAQEFQPAGARSQAMANASAANTDVWAAMNNQAAMAFLSKPAFGIYSESAFGLKDLSRGSIAFAMPVKNGAFGFGISYFGGTLFNRQMIGAGFAKKFAADVSGGIRLNYLNTGMGEYGSRGNLVVEASMFYQAFKSLQIGFHTFNPNRVYFNRKLDQRLPGLVKLGLAWQINEKVNWCTEVADELGKKPQFRSGLEYKPDAKLAFRTGFSTQPLQSSFGLGYRYKNLTIDAATSYHFVLGFSPRLGLVFDVVTKPRKPRPEKTNG